MNAPKSHAEAADALDVRHAQLVAEERELLAMAEDAVNCADKTDTNGARIRHNRTAREIMADVAKGRAEITRIEGCWTPKGEEE